MSAAQKYSTAVNFLGIHNESNTFKSAVYYFSVFADTAKRNIIRAEKRKG